MATATSEASNNVPRVEVRSRAELRRWLRAHHRQSQSIWLVTYKKNVPEYYLAYGDIVDEALCVGWIDSRPRLLDSQRTLHLLSPRKPGSGWSKRNKQRVAALLKAGSMSPAGQAVIERAKADGSWSKLDRVETLEIPPDLTAALAAHPPARSRFDAFPPSSRRLILEWIAQAKRAPTRRARIETTARQAARGLRANHYRQPKSSRAEG